MFGRSWSHPVAARRNATPRHTRAPRPSGALAPPTLHDDGAHAEHFATHPNKGWFTEWWYFNVRDPKTGLALLCVYAASPYGVLGASGAFGAMVFRDGEPVLDVMDSFSGAQITTSPERANVTLGPNRIEVVDADTYRIVARSSDDQIEWDLTLRRERRAEPAWLLHQAQGPLEGEVGYWMSWLPFARATGTITIKNKDGGEPRTYAIEDAAAYHDHNWGVWLSPARNWQWLQCSSIAEGVALDLGYSDGFDPPRVALLQVEGRAYQFDYGGIELPTYAGFQRWKDTSYRYPERATTTLIDRESRVKVEVEWSAPLRATDLMLTAIALFEQHVSVTLRVSERAGDGSWRPARTYTLDGIAEWSDSYVEEWQTGEGMVGGYVAEATVLGGGISGLSAAHELAERGFAVTVVEPEEALDASGVRGMAIGGMARSHYARVPRKRGAPPVNRPAGRPTPDARHDHWRDHRASFTLDSSEISDGDGRALDGAARAFLETYVEQGYGLRVTGSACAVERDPHALARRRAEAARRRLVERGVAADCVVLDVRDGDAPEATVGLEDYVLPGEHGFRFFPSYYRHVTDTMARTPVYDRDGRMTDRRVIDNLKPSGERLNLRSGQRPASGPTPTTTLQALRQVAKAINDDDYDPRDFLQFAIRLARYLATCPERREPLGDISWWNYLCGFSPATRCYLYRYSNSFSKDAVASGRVLAAFDWRYGDARTNGSTFVQLGGAAPGTSPSKFDGMLNGPTTEAWFVHWRKFLGERGVKFVSGSLERLEVERAHGRDVVVPWVRRPGRKAPEPWRPRTGEPHYVVMATDAPTAERASKPLPKVGVPKGLVGYTTVFDDKHRDPYTQPGLAKGDRFQTLTGIQYFFDQSFAIGGGAYSLDAPWSLTTVSVQQLWSHIPFPRKDGYGGMLTVDIGDFKVKAGATQKTAWDSTRERIGEQVWMQLSNDLRLSPFGPSPLRLPQPTWFHIDDNIEFGDRDDMKGVVVRNASPYLVPILKDWQKRPGPEPFDPNVPDGSPPGPAEPGVWTAAHGGYPVHWGSLVYAGIYLKTFTRMTTMESANESARHAVNAILDHYNAHHGSTVPPVATVTPHSPDPTKLEADQVNSGFIGDYCGIWNIERYEPSGFDSLKALDQVLLDLGLPHIFDLLGIEVLPSILSHLLPYRGDCAPWVVTPPPLIPPPAPWCPPFIGQKLGAAVGKVRSLFRPRRTPGPVRP